MTELATSSDALAFHEQSSEDVLSMPRGEKIKICPQCDPGMIAVELAADADAA